MVSVCWNWYQEQHAISVLHILLHNFHNFLTREVFGYTSLVSFWHFYTHDTCRLVYDNNSYYVAGRARGQYKVNPVFSLATRTGTGLTAFFCFSTRKRSAWNSYYWTMLAIKSQNAAEENQNSVHDNVKLNSANMITLALFITRGLVTKTTLFVFTPNDSRFTVHTVYHLHSIRKLRRENMFLMS